MPNTHSLPIKPAQPTIAHALPRISDDECLVRLARAIRGHDADNLAEVAQMIGRLAIPIE